VKDQRTQAPRRIDQPEACFVRLRGPDKRWYGARIYRRFGLLTAEIDGKPAEIDQVWTAGLVITEAEYHELMVTARTPPPF
jgi:hypothetical protein